MTNVEIKFDAHVDAELLEKAMKGLGTDEDAVIDIISKETVMQRKQVALTYKALFGKDLKKRLHSELSGHFRQAVLYSFYDMYHVNAKACYTAIKGAGTDEQVLIDVLCTSTNKEIEKLKAAYDDILVESKKGESHRNLETDIVGDTSGDFRCLLVAICQGKREKAVDEAQILQDCEDLYRGGEAKLGTDETLFTKIFVTRSWKALVKINEKYNEHIGHDLLVAIDKETSGDYRKALQTILKCAIDRNQCYAEILYNTMEGLGTRDDNLIRMIMAHSEVNLDQLKSDFEAKYNKTLHYMVKNDTSGDYRKFLLAIIG